MARKPMIYFMAQLPVMISNNSELDIVGFWDTM
jgi:hypothetical protein